MLLTNHPAHPNPPTGSANRYATPDRRGSRTCAPSSAPSPVRVHEIRVHSTVLQPLEAIAHTTRHAWMIRDTNPRHPRATPSGHWPRCLYRSSVAAFAGSHHARFRVYHSIVCARPDSKSVCLGVQPSPVRSLDESIAYRRSWPGRSFTQSNASSACPIILKIMRSTVMLFCSPSAPIRFVSPTRPLVRIVHTPELWSSVWIQSRTFSPLPYSFGR